MKEDQNVESVVGDRIAVYCVLRPKNKMLMSSTSWIPGNRTTRAAGFPKNVRPEQDFLKLVNVQRENAGQYKCTLIASDNSRQTIVITLFVREPGNLAQLNVNTTMLTSTLTSSSVTETETPRQRVLPLNAQDVAVCRAVEYGRSTLEHSDNASRRHWLPEDLHEEPLHGQLDVRRLMQIESNRTLFIRKVQMDDRERYYCQAEVVGNDGKMRELRHYVTMDVEPREAPAIKLDPSESPIQLEMFDSAFVHWHVLGGIPDPSVRWSRLTTVGSGRTVSQDASSSRVTLEDGGGLLAIRNADASVTGTYECAAENVEGSASQRVDIVVRTPHDMSDNWDNNE